MFKFFVWIKTGSPSMFSEFMHSTGDTANQVSEANLKIFLFPLTRPCFTGMGRSVGHFFMFSNWIPIKLNCIQ